MSEERRIKRWNNAAELYEKAAVSNAKRELVEEMNEILRFPRLEEWSTILRLLKASKEEIQIGYAEGGQGEIGYFLTKNGFSWKQMRNGEMYEEGLSSEPDDVRRLAEAFRNLYPSSERGSFNGVIFGEIEMVAARHPKPSYNSNFLEQ